MKEKLFATIWDMETVKQLAISLEDALVTKWHCDPMGGCVMTHAYLSHDIVMQVLEEYMEYGYPEEEDTNTNN